MTEKEEPTDSPREKEPLDDREDIVCRLANRMGGDKDDGNTALRAANRDLLAENKELREALLDIVTAGTADYMREIARTTLAAIAARAALKKNTQEEDCTP